MEGISRTDTKFIICSQGSNGTYPLYIYIYYNFQLILNIECTASENFTSIIKLEHY